MGRAGAEGFAELVEAGEVSLATSLEWHLVSNHYPPLPRELIPLCVEAIEKANEGAWDADVVSLPEDISYRGGDRPPTVSEVVESCHLEAFITYQEDL